MRSEPSRPDRLTIQRLLSLQRLQELNAGNANLPTLIFVPYVILNKISVREEGPVDVQYIYHHSDI